MKKLNECQNIHENEGSSNEHERENKTGNKRNRKKHKKTKRETKRGIQNKHNFNQRVIKVINNIITIVGICDSAEHFNDMDSAVRDNNNQRVHTNNTKQQHRLENKLKHML